MGGFFIRNFVLGYRDDLKGASAARRAGNVETYDAQGTWTGFKGLTVAISKNNRLSGKGGRFASVMWVICRVHIVQHGRKLGLGPHPH